MKIVDAKDTRTIDRLLSPARVDDRAFDRRVRTIVDEVRTGGDRALLRFARRFDHAAAPLEVSAKEMRTGAARVEPAVRRAIA
jgi:histidinol dehydrogenase